MRRLQCFADLLRNLERFIDRQRTSRSMTVGQRFSLDEFHDEELPFAGFFQSVNGCDVGVIQRRQHARFALESRHAFAVVTEGFGKKLDGDTAAQLGVGGLIDVAHAARTQMAGDLVMCEFGSDHDVMKICGRILSNNPQVTHVFESGRRQVRNGSSSASILG